jgi:predicted HAD superfamily Cof-like phosphohydrolase
MNEWQKMVYEFHQKFKLHIEPRPHIVPRRVADLRIALSDEENKELREGIINEDIIEIADALADKIYVDCGTAVSYGINLDPIFREVHRSNMTKLWDGKPKYNEAGKVVKPETFEYPKIGAEIKKQLDVVGFSLGA